MLRPRVQRQGPQVQPAPLRALLSASPSPSSPDATICPSGDQAARMTESAWPWKAATCM